MPIELPLLRLGLAGFSAEQQELAQRVLERSAPGHVAWQLSPFADADAWWLFGGRSTMVSQGVLRVAPGAPTARSLQINLADVDRPIAFALPLAGPHFENASRFDLAQPAQAKAVLEKFSVWLQPLVAQFGLASCLIDHYSALGPGVFDVMLDGRLIGVVDMRGQVSVLPTAGPAEFADAMWRRRPSADHTPEHFLTTSVSHLMWQYAVRTKRDLLPTHYRTGPLYFRRPPHLPQRLMKDAHLLLLRELATVSGSFPELEQRTGLVGNQLARPLAALYYVGAITSNPKRAAHSTRRADSADSTASAHSSVMPSMLDSKPGTIPPPLPNDLTAPAPLIR
jgi:hypothetical protein